MFTHAWYLFKDGLNRIKSFKILWISQSANFLVQSVALIGYLKLPRRNTLHKMDRNISPSYTSDKFLSNVIIHLDMQQGTFKKCSWNCINLFLIPVVIWEYFLTGNKRPLIPAFITKYRQKSAPNVFFLLKILHYCIYKCDLHRNNITVFSLYVERLKTRFLIKNFCVKYAWTRNKLFHGVLVELLWFAFRRLITYWYKQWTFVLSSPYLYKEHKIFNINYHTWPCYMRGKMINTSIVIGVQHRIGNISILYIDPLKYVRK